MSALQATDVLLAETRDFRERRRAMKEHELAEEIEKFRKSSKGKPMTCSMRWTSF
jgi:hypothetical protein